MALLGWNANSQAALDLFHTYSVQSIFITSVNVAHFLNVHKLLGGARTVLPSPAPALMLKLAFHLVTTKHADYVVLCFDHCVVSQKQHNTSEHGFFLSSVEKYWWHLFLVGWIQYHTTLQKRSSFQNFVLFWEHYVMDRDKNPSNLPYKLCTSFNMLIFQVR
jgi:hypothetical protein